MLGKFGKEFLGVYGDSIDQDAIYNFDVMDYTLRDELYECFLSIGSSESVAVLEEKCPIYCLEEVTSSEMHEELENENSDSHIYMIKRAKLDSHSEDDETMEEILEDGDHIGHTMYIHNELWKLYDQVRYNYNNSYLWKIVVAVSTHIMEVPYNKRTRSSLAVRCTTEKLN